MNHELHCAARLSRAGSNPVLLFVDERRKAFSSAKESPGSIAWRTRVEDRMTRMRHCAITPQPARHTACKGESCRIPDKIEGKVRDIVPTLLGSPTFIPELSRMAARYTKE
jgi:hypothetical protein